MASVRAMGLVVYVIRNVPMMSRMIRSTICTAAIMPSHVMLRSSHTSATGVPAVKNMFMMAVNATTKYTGFSPLVSDLNGTLDTSTDTVSTAIMIP